MDGSVDHLMGSMDQFGWDEDHLIGVRIQCGW